MLFYILMESLFLVVLVYFLFLLLYLKLDSFYEMMSCYECGFDVNSVSRVVFSYRFFLLSILFIIFDVKISLMLPIPYVMVSFMGVYLFYFFIFVLMMGFFYEYFYGSLDWLDCFIMKN
uniref:NADH-ubiquinone oxidoreductase chain 3 n=1 Tax=Oxyopes hupingensis TaxID=2713554 RepID=A0A6G6D9W8_9ARAC|nr:NADH dehydrogenase subunit 3 [Oxyopes hupingensis]QIE13341.1 NADH dehydrogenase subunit 3 [Oxyopes hupingensis]